MDFDSRKLFYDTNKSKLFKYKNDIYKLFKGYVSEELETQVIYNFLIRKEVSKQIILPTGLLREKDDWLCGYVMNYVDGQTLRNEIDNCRLTTEDKVFIINELFEELKEIHYYLTVGDIRNSNLMIGKDGHAYMIDFDFAVRNESSRIPFVSYQVSYEDEFLNDKNGDIAKLFISTLSLLYNYNIEFDMKHNEDVTNISNFVPYNGTLKEYYDYFINKIYRHEPITEYLKIPLEENVEKDILVKKRKLLQ